MKRKLTRARRNAGKKKLGTAKTGQRKRVVVFACQQGNSSRKLAYRFRRFLKQRNLEGKFEIKAVSAKRNPERMQGADIVVSPYFVRKPRQLSMLSTEILDFRQTVSKMAPNVKKQKIVFSEDVGKLDFPATFEFILKKTSMDKKVGKKA